ncbi:signal peptidase II [Serratia microhaemolytica]|uniref:signal peptidase II n=1 Tax=Serratia microhaemolytica TaxID=2675110 RepID=UPI000FDDA03D|nr:signal peptidase II [Serratia microhaemolytica]
MSNAIRSTGLRWLWLALLALVLDFASKQWILHHFELGQSQPLFPFFNLYYARNYGAAFSFLAGHSGWQRWFFASIAVIIVLILLVMMYRSCAKERLTNIAYALIIGGAVGNLIDRLWHGFVIDFIDFYIGRWHYPTFNLADTFICIGALLVLLDSLLPGKKKPSTEKDRR